MSTTVPYSPEMDGRLIWNDGDVIHEVFAVPTADPATVLMATRCGLDVPPNRPWTPGPGETLPAITCPRCRRVISTSGAAALAPA